MIRAWERTEGTTPAKPDATFARYVVSSTGRLHRPISDDGTWFAMCGDVRPAWTRLTPPIVYAETALLSPSVTCGTCERVMVERGMV